MKRIIGMICLLLFFALTASGQGSLETAQQRLSKENNADIFRTNPNSSDNLLSQNDRNLGRITKVFVEIGLYATYYGLIESPMERKHKGRKAFITKHPYFISNKGNYSYNWGADTNLYRITAANRFLKDTDQLYGNTAHIDFRFLKRMSLEANYLQLWEHESFYSNSSLATYTILAKYNRIRTEKFNAYWGVGATYIAGEVEEFGFTYGIGAEYFFINPLSIEINYNQSFINSFSSNRLNSLLNYHINQYKIIGGYEYLRIGGFNFSTISVGLGLFI
ncbi:hypothetical protein [uncultured Aquimarina sp.]|uniref:hypothetical protein n=1 Tax=uncultured Aquimarina sp. TaxID=575652 RepID=UPI00263513EE|nr:hypothetical protein [uncultured Aquimarina sp.]